jgi:F0F1-type ATP synthase assembly protein I
VLLRRAALLCECIHKQLSSVLKGPRRTVFSTNDKRAMNQGFGDGMSRAFELVVTPMVFGAIGFLIDQIVGTTPWFTAVLATFGVIGTFVRLWYGYDQEMRSHEAAGRWARREGAAAPAEPPADLWTARRREGAQ